MTYTHQSVTRRMTISDLVEGEVCGPLSGRVQADLDSSSKPRIGMVQSACKYLALGVICAGLAACDQIPEWWEQRSIEPEYDYMLVGYGDGEIVGEAVMSARIDISRALLTHIESESRKQQIFSCLGTAWPPISPPSLEWELAGWRFCERYIGGAAIPISINLEVIRVIRQERSKGRFYVAVEYDTRIIHEKILDP